MQRQRWPSDLYTMLLKELPGVDVVAQGIFVFSAALAKSLIRVLVGMISVPDAKIGALEREPNATMSPPPSTAMNLPRGDAGPLIVEILENEHPVRRRAEQAQGGPDNPKKTSSRSPTKLQDLDDVFFLIRTAFLNGDYTEVEFLRDARASTALDIMHRVLMFSISFEFCTYRFWFRRYIRKLFVGPTSHIPKRGTCSGIFTRIFGLLHRNTQRVSISLASESPIREWYLEGRTPLPTGEHMKERLWQ